MYKPRDESALRWGRIQRRLTRELDMQIKDWRDEALNRLLSQAWTEFAANLNEGKIVELDTVQEAWVAAALDASKIGR